MFYNIPSELQALRQWVLWRKVYREDDTITKMPFNAVTGELASVSNPLTWNTFDYVMERTDGRNGMGFVFTKSDPYIGIDIDGKAGQDKASDISQKLASYTETSPSGLGLHVIVKGQLSGAGRRRDGVEIYDTGRFFTFTGNRINENPIVSAGDEFFALYDSLGKQKELTANDFLNQLETVSDDEVYSRACNAHNGSKFIDLWQGRWELHYGNASQSEADLALINIITFYTQNRAQIARLFRLSILGSRAKAQRNDYVNYMIRKAFDRMPSKVDVDTLYNRGREAMAMLGLPPGIDP
jgi:primase-polymerase (primpol)-like protein